MWSITAKSFESRDGMVDRVNCIEIEWKTEDGKQVMSEKAGSGFLVEAGLVLLAMGFTGPGRNEIADGLGLERDGRGNIKVSAAGMTGADGIFSAGDMSTGQSLVVRAINDGRRCGAGIIKYLKRGSIRGKAFQDEQ